MASYDAFVVFLMVLPRIETTRINSADPFCETQLAEDRTDNTELNQD